MSEDFETQARRVIELRDGLLEKIESLALLDRDPDDFDEELRGFYFTVKRFAVENKLKQDAEHNKLQQDYENSRQWDKVQDSRKKDIFGTIVKIGLAADDGTLDKYQTILPELRSPAPPVPVPGDFSNRRVVERPPPPPSIGLLYDESSLQQPSYTKNDVKFDIPYIPKSIPGPAMTAPPNLSQAVAKNNRAGSEPISSGSTEKSDLSSSRSLPKGPISASRTASPPTIPGFILNNPVNVTQNHTFAPGQSAQGIAVFSDESPNVPSVVTTRAAPVPTAPQAYIPPTFSGTYARPSLPDNPYMQTTSPNSGSFTSLAPPFQPHGMLPAPFSFPQSAPPVRFDQYPGYIPPPPMMGQNMTMPLNMSFNGMNMPTNLSYIPPKLSQATAPTPPPPQPPHLPAGRRRNLQPYDSYGTPSYGDETR